MPLAAQNLLGIQQISNPSTGNHRILTLADSLWYKSNIHFSLELVVQIKQKGDTGVENPHSRSFLGGA